MKKIFQKMKRWFAGLTSVVLMLTIFAPAVSTASATMISVDEEVTNDTTPVITGTVSNTAATVTVTVDGHQYTDTDVTDGTWSVEVSNALAPGKYEVVATDGTYTDETNMELTIDVTAPMLTEVTKVPIYTNMTNPTYEFNTDEAGQVSYTGSCGVGDLGSAVTGKNIVSYAGLTEGYYANCGIAITDLATNVSKTLPVSPFTVDLTAPKLTAFEDYVAPTSAESKTATTEKFLADKGVYIEEEYQIVDVTTDWQLVGAESRLYDVTYRATDMAGNVSAPVTVGVDLLYLSNEALGTPDLVELLEPLKSVTEKGDTYHDAGATISWGQAGPVYVWTFGNLDLRKVGEYHLGYRAQQQVPSVDPAVIAEEESYRTVEVMDTTGPAAVTGLSVYAGNGFAQLCWDKPADDDLAGYDIYRSNTRGLLGKKIAEALSADTTSFDDYSVENGKTYYYTVIAFDLSGNSSPQSIQVVAKPKAPKKVYVASVAGSSSADQAPDQDVKADDTTNNNTETDSDTNPPTVGIIILILLIALGIYLLYLQNPDIFKKLKFWGNPKK